MAPSCPKCGHPNPVAKHLSGSQMFMGLVFAGLAIWWLASGGFEKRIDGNIKAIENKVAEGAVTQYNIAKRQGNAIQVCVQAGFVSAAYLQAKDEPNYQTWKKTEQFDCKRAGIVK